MADRENRRAAGLRPNRPIPAGFVWITHPDIEGGTRVAEQSLDHWKARGWTASAEQGPPPAAAPAPAGDVKAATTTPRRGAPTGQES